VVAGATISVSPICPPGGCARNGNQSAATGVTGPAGVFELTTTPIPDGWGTLLLQVTSDGHEPTTVPISAAGVSNVEVMLFRTLTIGPGDSAEMRLFSGSYVGGWESHLCRRVVIESPSGGVVDVEVIPAAGGGDVGVLQSEEPFAQTLGRRITVAEGPVWIYPLAARRHEGGGSGLIGIFEQHVTIRVSQH
jgi:hypothetical protein